MWRVSEGLSWPERCLCASLGQEVGSPSWRIATILKAGDWPISTSTEIHEADLGELNGIDTFGALPVCGGIEILVARHAGAQGRLESQVGATTWKAGGSTGVMALPLDGAKKMCWSAIFTFTSFTSFTTVPLVKSWAFVFTVWVHHEFTNHQETFEVEAMVMIDLDASKVRTGWSPNAGGPTYQILNHLNPCVLCDIKCVKCKIRQIFKL